MPATFTPGQEGDQAGGGGFLELQASGHRGLYHALSVSFRRNGNDSTELHLVTASWSQNLNDTVRKSERSFTRLSIRLGLLSRTVSCMMLDCSSLRWFCQGRTFEFGYAVGFVARHAHVSRNDVELQCSDKRQGKRTEPCCSELRTVQGWSTLDIVRHAQDVQKSGTSVCYPR